MSGSEKVSRTITGRVISDKMNKTITVLVERKVPHPVYKKYVRRSTKIHAHDETNQCKEGDTVLIEQCRPLAKSKSWRLVKVIAQAVA